MIEHQKRSEFIEINTDEKMQRILGQHEYLSSNIKYTLVRKQNSCNQLTQGGEKSWGWVSRTLPTPFYRNEGHL